MMLKFKINEKLHFAFEIARRRARGKNLCIDENLIKVKNTASSAGALSLAIRFFFGIVVRKSRLKALCLVHIMQFQLFPMRLPFFLLALHHVAPNFRRLSSQMATSSSCAPNIDVFFLLSHVYCAAKRYLLLSDSFRHRSEMREMLFTDDKMHQHREHMSEH